MELTTAQLQVRLMKDYYKNFSKYAKGKLPEHKIAWVTSFTPIEILEALDIEYYYPESYSAVIAASGKEQELLAESDKQFLSGDCCSYSCCFEGSVSLQKGPRGIPPKPDVLIATNNQCNTLPNWWNILAKRYNVPLIVLDYPGEVVGYESSFLYVKKQHEEFIAEMEKISGNTIDIQRLEDVIHNSVRSIEAWKQIIEYMPIKDMSDVNMFDSISFLITSRCKEDTAKLYEKMKMDIDAFPEVDPTLIPIFWLGYPLWYHKKRYLEEEITGCRIAGSNYITWWNLDYSGEDVFEKLFRAYNYTFLNLSQESRTSRLIDCISKSGSVATITLHNKSCKCDFVSAQNIGLPQAELEIDMIDKNILNIDKAKRQIELLREAVCIR